MNILKITIATLIISQSALASYGKAIVGGVIGGATTAIVSNTLSTKPTATIATNESSNNARKYGEINIECYCNYSNALRAIKRVDGSTTFHCIRNNKLGRTLLSTQKEMITFISKLTTYTDGAQYCNII